MNVVFIDIDGPLISTPQLMRNNGAAIGRSLMNQNAVIYVNKLCERAAAKLVTNSSHNYHMCPRGLEEYDLRHDLIKHGIDEKHFHDDWRTAFGTDYNVSRFYGVQNWLNKYKPDNWVGFDDMKYTDAANLIHVSFDDGITYNDYLKALDHFGIRDRISL